MNFSDAPPRMEKWITEVRERGRRHFREYTSIEAGASQLQQTNPRLQPDASARLGARRNEAKRQRQMDLEIRSAAPHRLRRNLSIPRKLSSFFGASNARF